MSQQIQIKVKVDATGISDHFADLCNDSTTKLWMNQELARFCDPYVPFLNGPLSQTVEVTSECIKYVQPYAHYQYHGVGFNHTLDYHPKATALWDEAMLQERGEEFREQIRSILVRRYKELYG